MSSQRLSEKLEGKACLARHSLWSQGLHSSLRVKEMEMDSTYKPMSLFMKIVFWFVAINALAGAISLILFPANTDTLFFDLCG